MKLAAIPRLPALSLVALSAALSGCVSVSVVGAQPAISQGGRGVSIAVAPGADPYLLVASETGGLFRSQDGGAHWSHVDGLPSWRVRDVAYSPSNGNIVIATTEDDYVSAGNGGIWRSIDGGITWARPPSAIPPAGAACTDRLTAHGISFDRTSGRVIVGTDCGIAVGTGDGWAWSHVVINPTATGGGSVRHRVLSVLALPGNRIYAIGDRAIGVSTNGGGTWTRATGEPSHGRQDTLHAIAASPFNVDHVFIVANSSTETNVLYVTSDGGLTWSRAKTGNESSGRPAFVRSAPAADGASNAFDVFFGDGVHLWRGRYRNGSVPTLIGSFQQVSVDHTDPSDVAFSRDGVTPILVATDGGVHRSADGGASWTLTGGAQGGYNALQITDATGQLVGGSEPHVDLYFATQDNSIWASSDGGTTWPSHFGGEGFHLRTARRADADAANAVTGSQCAPCRSFLADSHLANAHQWPNAPDGDSIVTDDQGVPFLIHPGKYVQRVVNNDVIPPAHSLMLTTDTGAHWVTRGPLPPGLVGPPIVAGSGTPSPVIYYAISRAGTIADGSSRLGLVRIDNLYGPGDVSVRDADTGLGSVGTFPTMFAQYRVLGVSPTNPDRLVVPDIGTGEMKSSTDGGTSWSVESQLTALVTDGGTYRFSVNGKSLASTIFWDPDNDCQVLVGTRQNGILRSTDGGATWERVPDSSKITNISSFFFESPTSVLVSSYGRGLWRMLMNPAPVSCGRRLVSVPPPTAVLEVWTLTHAKQLYREPGDPPICPQCTYVLVHWGEVTGVQLSGGRLESLSISGGLVQHVTRTNVAQPLPRIEIAVLPPSGKSADMFSEIRRQNLAVRGVVLEGSQLRAFIAGRGDLKTAGLRPPLLELFPLGVASGEPTLAPGQVLIAHASGFISDAEGGARVSLTVDGRVEADFLVVDKNGEVRYEFAIREHSGEHVIELVQTDTLRARVVRQFFNVVPRGQLPN